MPINPSTPAPIVPTDAPADWSTVARGNQFSNIQRLGRWIGGTKPVATLQDPSPFFSKVTPFSVGQILEDGTVPTIYVATHGWAPGFRPVVDAQGGNLLWWDSQAQVSGRWEADWCWAPVGPFTTPKFSVSTTGFFQQILTRDPNAITLAYSWIDDSATDDSETSDYRSEAHTHLNGMRLANALLDAIDPSFFQAGGRIHLIGHSHGSKVATVAALTLQQRGIQATRLTILDSPESLTTILSNGANLLGFYLEGMEIRDPSSAGAPGTFVEIYPSCFGVGYATSDPKSPLNNIVEVALKPSQIYDKNYASAHQYAAGWYSGAAAGAASEGQPPIGLAWPPVPAVYQPALNQTWPGGGFTQENQWLLAPGPSQFPRHTYTPNALSVTQTQTTGKVDGTPDTGLRFLPASADRSQYSTFTGTFPSNGTHQSGLVFDLEWTAPQPGDYLIVTAGGRPIHTLLALDGQSVPTDKTSIAVNCTILDPKGGTLTIYYLGSSDFGASQVVFSNFQWLAVAPASVASPYSEEVASASL